VSEDARTTDPGTRGKLTIADRVVDKIAGRAALDVDGVVVSGSGLDKVVGRRLPKVTTRTRGAQTRVGVDIAVEWPRSAAEVAAQVRSAVSEAVTGYAGLKVLAVDVSVVRLESAHSQSRRRVT
jgi:uncharacterized alkaline shock family protein YloU